MSEPTRPRPGWYPDGSGQRYWDGDQWTPQFRHGPDDSHHRWWTWSPAYTVGVIAFIPALHAAIKLRRRELWIWASGLILGDILVWVLVSADSNDPDAAATPIESVGLIVALVLAVAGTTHAFRVRDEVLGPTAQTVRSGSRSAKDDPAVARSRADQLRRAESISLVKDDPGLARDLRVGRPDLERRYDDGGLVDVNRVPVSILESYLGLSPGQAQTLVEVRDATDGFESVDDLIIRCDLPPRALDAVRDRIVTL